MQKLCDHIGECGGCSSQGVAYPAQLQQKQLIIEKLFPQAAPIVPCKNPWRYRNKMEFSFSQNKAGEKFLGLIMRQSRGKVFNLQECLLSPSWFAQTLKRVKAWWDQIDLSAFHFHRGTGTLRTLTLREGRRTGDRLAMLTVSGDPQFALKRAQLNGFLAALDDPQMSTFLRVQQCIPKTPTQFYEMHLCGPDHICEELSVAGKSLTFKISPSSFFQPNTEQAEVLYTKVLEMAPPSSLVYDLYCGTATLGMALALQSKKVLAIELNPYAVFDARINAEKNQISNINIECGDVGKLLKETTEHPDLVVVDPPRAGLDALAIRELGRLRPHKILYVSCNPTTQASNIAQLEGYHVERVQPVDQFPHTPHIENIVLLSL